LNATLKDLGAKVTDGEIHVELAADVLFDFDKFTLRPVANDTLKKVGQVVAGYPDAPLLIEGYTDGKGTHDYNIKLSQNRAAAVKKWLVDKAGIKASRIATKGLGESKPVAPNRKPDGSDDPEGRQKKSAGGTDAEHKVIARASIQTLRSHSPEQFLEPVAYRDPRCSSGGICNGFTP